MTGTLSPSRDVAADIPVENIVALLEAASGP